MRLSLFRALCGALFATGDAVQAPRRKRPQVPSKLAQSVPWRVGVRKRGGV
jgi:hypothetical protein